MNIEWRDRYSVGIDIIDNQHKQLITIINQLNDTIIAGDTRAKQNKILVELFKYTRYHFSSEESLLLLFDEHSAAAHKKEHDNFFLELSDLYDQAEKNSADVTLDLMKQLRTWLVDHILGSDRILKVNSARLNQIMESGSE